MKRIVFGLMFFLSMMLLNGCCPNSMEDCEPSCGSCNVSSVGWY